MLKEEVAKKYYKNRCYVCRKKYGKYFQFHHLWYLNNGDVTYKQFNDTKKYNEALMPLVLQNKKRFLLLCRAHHKYVEWAASIKNKDMWDRFIKARRMTRK